MQKNILLLLFFVFALSACNPLGFYTNKKSSVSPRSKYTYAWVYGNWLVCSKPCGGGAQNRDVYCQRNDKQKVVDKYCTGTKPDHSRSCNIQACNPNETWQWNVGEWNDCSKNCGTGTHDRSVICQNQEGEAGPDANCPLPKPVTRENCNTQTCPLYDWNIGDWSACQGVQCGSIGVKTRSVSCVQSGTTPVADSLCPQPKPAAEIDCDTDPCQQTYHWDIGNWGLCYGACSSQGTQSRLVNCVLDQNGQFVSGTLCPQPKPSTTQSCPTTECPPQYDTVEEDHTVPAAAHKVDLLLVADDSQSMLPQNRRLAQALGGFITELEGWNIDWQMCVTSTDCDSDSWCGAPFIWSLTNPATHIMKPNIPNKSQIFTQTIEDINKDRLGSNDEQGIKAMDYAIKDYDYTRCLRPDAAFAAILISDEDERSVGGNSLLDARQYRPLTAFNDSNNFIQDMHALFGADKRYTVNSIVIKDAQCLALQNNEGVPGFLGTKYIELSTKTKGYVGDICSTNYPNDNLKIFRDKILNSLAKIQLKCTPVGNPEVTYNPNPGNIAISLNEVNELVFKPALGEGTQVHVKYLCPKGSIASYNLNKRTPASQNDSPLPLWLWGFVFLMYLGVFIGFYKKTRKEH